ncbi:methyl-accepting chemotaxis protein [Desulfovulcanus sp.]
MFEFISQRLNLKILLLIGVMSLAIFSILIIFIAQGHKDALIKQISLSCSQKAELLKLAIEKPMIIGDDEATKEEFNILAQKDKTTSIYLTNYKGNITYSTNSDAVRKNFDSLFPQKNIVNLISSGLKEIKQSQLMIKVNKRRFFIKTMSIKNEPSCYHCHETTHPILGEIIVMQDITDTIADIHKQLYEMSAISVVGFFFLISVIWFFIRRVIVNPITNIATALKEIAQGEGDLTARISVHSRDEIGRLAQYFNEFVENLQAMIKDIVGNTQTLNSSSSNLSELSTYITSETERMLNKSNTVAAASEEVSSNMNSVAAAMEEASTNVTLIAAAAQQMSDAVNEIVERTEKTQTITSEAVSKVESASAKIEKLGKAAKEITTITDTITAISEQTNLLALNATIEAARAGEAGKGFAVVANEIKELARQTAASSEEIKSKIESIQASTEGSVAEVVEISQVITEVNEVVSSIVAALEEQAATTNEIASNVSEASLGIQEVTENVAKSSVASSEISKEIVAISEATNKLSGMSSQVSSSAEELLGLARKLQHLVERFKI